jgi:hypothetical protein
MEKYEYLHAAVTNRFGTKDCLLKKTAGKQQVFAEMPAIEKQTGERIKVFPNDEIRIFGNEPLSDHLLQWYKEALIGTKRKELKNLKEFFPRSFWERVWEWIKSTIRFLIP